MKKSIIIIFCVTTLLSSCGSEFNRVYKYADNDYKYEYAKQSFAMGKYHHAITFLQDLVTLRKGRETGQESLYLLGMAEFCNRDYESASATFRKYFTTYPKGYFAEQAAFYVGQSLYQSVPEPRLDQTPTLGAINAYQQFLDLFPVSIRQV